MKLKRFDYNLPKKLIAQKPIRPRDHSRLMILNRKNQTIKHDYFYNLGKYLKPDDVLVANNSKVIPARLYGIKPTGGKIEILLLKRLDSKNWETIIKGKVKPGLKIKFNHNLFGVLISLVSTQIWQIKFNLSGPTLTRAIYRSGQTPTPPYIKRLSNLKEYQTIYAKHPGSAAAPTAGFHFTKKLISKLKKQGIQFEFVTLHVGLGTFQPVRTENIEAHKMHPELAELRKEVADKLNQSKTNNQRIIAIGTTATRVLESFCSYKKLQANSGWLNLFVYPGYQFKFIDGLITNFHLPKSTLLMLVAAFAGQKFIFRAYQQAIKKKYRFYSFGDAMLII